MEGLISTKRIIYLLVVLILVVGAGLTGVLVGGVAVYQAVQNAAVGTSTTSQLADAPALPITQNLQINTSDIQTTITDAVSRLGPAVVTVVGQLPPQQSFFGLVDGGTVSGSGVIFSPDGYVMTNNHVIENTISLKVIFASGEEREAKVIGSDKFQTWQSLRQLD